jgi:hypothetical protein
MPTSRTWQPVAVLALIALLAGCAQSINSVLADPGRYRNREVRVRGHVSDSVSVVGRGLYRIEDRGQSLWVFSDHGVPRNGANVSVKGTIREGFNLGGFGDRLPRGIGTGLVLVENSHRASD